MLNATYMMGLGRVRNVKSERPILLAPDNVKKNKFWLKVEYLEPFVILRTQKMIIYKFLIKDNYSEPY